jgi:cytoskeleton protein RodZ
VNSNDAPETPEAEAPAPTAGMILQQAREAAGLTIDDVALQLKLAPRQVVAIERDYFANLPGRTFIRGFVRNYARLLKLDSDAVLGALTGEHATPTERTPRAATSRAMGEMPMERPSRPNIARWAIPLVLVAIVAIAAFYEFARPQASRAPAPVTPIAPATPPTSSAVPLTNPARPATETATIAPATTEATAPSAATVPPSEPPTGAANSATSTVSATQETTAAARSNQLALRFRGTSWVEVRDRSGNVVLSMTGSDGATREIVIAPPGEVTVGNAGVVDATWRGRSLDVMAQSRQNVARIRLD